VPVAQIPEEQERAAAVAAIDAWVSQEFQREESLVAAERQDVTDRTASHRWYLRFKGEEKDFITVWLTLGQRTLHHEAQFMPAPDENAEAVYRYVLRRNADLYAMWFCLGPEDAIYLVGRVAAAEVNAEELDRIAGSSIHYVDEHFPTAMTLGYPKLYRRRPRRG
jgi:Putative bacterial sensory transduction regulator